MKEIQEELRARTVDEPGKVVYLDVKHVLITSDEPRDSPFWKEVKQYGWFSIDHVKERTEEKYGGYVACFFLVLFFDPYCAQLTH